MKRLSLIFLITLFLNSCGLTVCDCIKEANKYEGVTLGVGEEKSFDIELLKSCDEMYKKMSPPQLLKAKEKAAKCK